MRITIIIIILWLLFPVICRFLLKRRMRDVIPNESLRFWGSFVLILLFVYLNRYSLLALPIFIRVGYPFGQAVGQAFVMNNDVVFFVDKMYQLCAELGKEIPRYLDNSLSAVKDGTAGLFDMVGDLFEIVLFVWSSAA